MSLSELDWTKWEIRAGIKAGQAFVSDQGDQETCVSHALGKGIFETLQTKFGLYRGDTQRQLKGKQEEIIKNVIAIHGKLYAISPCDLHGKSIDQDGIKLTMEVTMASRNGSSNAFADATQRKSFLSDGYNFLILLCDANFLHNSTSGGGLHAVYVTGYDVKTQTFSCVNSWDKKNPEPEIHDYEEKITKFYVFGVRLLEEEEKPSMVSPAQPSAAQQQGLFIANDMWFP